MDLREDEVGHRGHPHITPHLTVVVVLGEHKLQGLLRTAIIGLESLLHAHIGAGDSSTLELDHADEPIVDDADELRLDALVDGSMPAHLDTTDALSLDIDLICEGLWAEDTPRRTVVVELLGEELPTGTEDGTALLLGAIDTGFHRATKLVYFALSTISSSRAKSRTSVISST